MGQPASAQCRYLTSLDDERAHSGMTFSAYPALMSRIYKSCTVFTQETYSLEKLEKLSDKKIILIILLPIFKLLIRGWVAGAAAQEGATDFLFPKKNSTPW